MTPILSRSGRNGGVTTLPMLQPYHAWEQIMRLPG